MYFKLFVSLDEWIILQIIIKCFLCPNESIEYLESLNISSSLSVLAVMNPILKMCKNIK